MVTGTPAVLAACFNHPYVPHVATMLRSIAESGAQPARCYLVGDESVSPAEQRTLLSFARECGIAAESLSVSDDLLAGFGDLARYPRVAWYRTVLADALPHEDRLVYLDSDVLILHDLQALWDTVLSEGHLFGAVCHPSYGGGANHLARLGLSARTPYFNSGVMVMDLAAMRSEAFGLRTREFAVSGGRPVLPFADQDAMNALFVGRWTALDPAWNCLSSILLPFLFDASWAEDIHHEEIVLERAARSPAVVHFEGPPILRPWHRRCFNPFAGLYRHYRGMTPWPLTELEGRGRDALFSRIPPRWQAKMWHLRRRAAGPHGELVTIAGERRSS